MDHKFGSAAAHACISSYPSQYKGNFTQFYETRSERRKNQLREYEASVAKRAHLQAFIDRWRYNANRAAQAQSKIKELERMPEVEAPEQDEVVRFRLPETDKLPPPLLQLDNVTFGYTPDRILLRDVNFDVGMESRIAIVGSNGAGKSTLMKLLMGNINPISGDQKRNNRLRIGYFSQHHIDQVGCVEVCAELCAGQQDGPDARFRSPNRSSVRLFHSWILQ